jgi:murein tripeptide amidase MpaA
MISSLTLGQTTGEWKTYYEKSNYLKTPRYAETIEYCKRLAVASPWVRYESFGKSPQGRDLPLVILSKDKAFTPTAAAKSKKAVILIQSGIHAGEIDGKDASLMLMRDIAITKTKAHLLDHAIILIVPIFSVDGHERFGKFNRINQDGPEEMGWRVTANNLNLNRDYMKADAQEMRAMLRLFSSWLPDFYVDCHVTDGIDFQYSVTFATEIFQNIDAEIAAWLKQKYIPVMTAQVERSGKLIAPYMTAREDNDLSKGFIFSAASPRFSTGYGAAQNRPSVLIETHVYKPYRTRVEATYEVLNATIGIVNANAESLRRMVRQADARAVSAAAQRKYIPLQYKISERSKPITFRGWKTTRSVSPVSGALMTYTTHDTTDVTVPYFDEPIVTDSVQLPDYYIIPQEWTGVIAGLSNHHVMMRRMTRTQTLPIEGYQLTEPKWREKPYEGRHVVSFKTTRVAEERTFPAGTYIVPAAQRTAKVIAHLLEPKGPDSFASWGMFDAIFEQKEYYEDGVMEAMAKTMMAKDPSLKREFEAKLAADSAFAKNADARLNFFYVRTPYADQSIGMYPIARYTGTLR